MKQKLQSLFLIFFFIFGIFLPNICGDFADSKFFLKNDIINYLSIDNEPFEEWNKTFGGIFLDWGWSVQNTSDGGFIIVGETVSYSVGSYDAWMIKTDSYGNEQWNRTYGGFAKDGGRSVDLTLDGGYVIGGYTDSYGFPGHDFWLIKTDNFGNEQWNKTFGGLSTDAGFSVIATLDGGYVITGYVTSFGHGGYDMWVIKTDSYGIEEWNRTFGGLNEDYGMYVQQTYCGDFILTGFTSSFGFGNDDLWLVKIDNNGNELWNKTFGGIDNDWGSCIYETKDLGYIITGDTRSFGTGGYDMWVIKTDSNGNEQWNVTFGDSLYDDTGYFVQQTDDEGYIITGTKTSFQTGLTDICLIKTDKDGLKQWDLVLGGGSNDWSYCLDQTSSGDYIITGFTDSFGSGDLDVFLIKINANNSENQPPENPTITGEINGVAGENYEYTICAVDPNGDDIFYYIDWGDGEIEEWIGPYSSGETVKLNHTWVEKGTYMLKVKAKDCYNSETNWTILEITMPFYKQIKSNPINNIFFDRYLTLEKFFIYLIFSKFLFYF